MKQINFRVQTSILEAVDKLVDILCVNKSTVYNTALLQGINMLLDEHGLEPVEKTEEEEKKEKIKALRKELKMLLGKE